MQTQSKPARNGYFRDYYAKNRDAIRARFRARYQRKMEALGRFPKPLDATGKPVKVPMPQRSRAFAGNAKYRELIRQENEWLKNATFCEICKQWHPPMKFDYID